MQREMRIWITALFIISFISLCACVTPQTEPASATVAPSPTLAPSPMRWTPPSPTPARDADYLPILDAFLEDETFRMELKDRLGLSGEQIIPNDTRIVINAPSYRMDIFENGKLMKSYRIGIGYPEFPLPAGMRTANAIIFNPTWTPPDEPWVESPSSKVNVGQTVEAGSKFNPLGLIKIPIGPPSLIHGGKSLAQLSSFASHGCVGLTDAQVIDLSKRLARLGGIEITDKQIARYKQNRAKTKNIALQQPITVELRYETIIVEDGKLYIYRDVYEHGTNTEANLRNVLNAYGLTLENLSESERSRVGVALDRMGRNAAGVKVPAAKST